MIPGSCMATRWSWPGQDGTHIRAFGIRGRTFILGAGLKSASSGATDGIGTTTGQNTTTNGITPEAEPITTGITITAAAEVTVAAKARAVAAEAAEAIVAAGAEAAATAEAATVRQRAAKQTEVRMEVPANVGVQARTIKDRLRRTIGRIADMEAREERVILALVVSVTITMAARREATPKGEGRASGVEALVVSTGAVSAAVVFTLGPHIANRVTRSYF